VGNNRGNRKMVTRIPVVTGSKITEGYRKAKKEGKAG
jgi:hypothetical protein